MLYLPIWGAGKTWLNNNLGADYSNFNKPSFNPEQQAITFNDWRAYGSFIQWGRYTDGHELINWTNGGPTPINGVTTTQSITDTPGNVLFIAKNDGSQDWRSTQNNNLWQGILGINNPCPQGYRVPTINDFVSYFSTINNSLAFDSPLKISIGGIRWYDGLYIFNSPFRGNYWTSDTYSNQSNTISFRTDNNNISNNNYYGRAAGQFVRCVRD
jgi:hypothetical protein